MAESSFGLTTDQWQPRGGVEIASGIPCTLDFGSSINVWKRVGCTPRDSPYRNLRDSIKAIWGIRILHGSGARLE